MFKKFYRAMFLSRAASAANAESSPSTRQMINQIINTNLAGSV